MKKAFTLLEIIISITLFSILMIFLYKTIDQTEYSNQLFNQKEVNLRKSNALHNIFLEDIAESSSISISTDKNKNSIVKIVSNNTYHNVFYTNITYLIGSSKTLVRIESLEAFQEESISSNFLDNSYIDVLLDNVEYFEAKNKDTNYIFVIKQKLQERKLYTMYKLR
ncbi:prepilin-type N-terminal cleavage/methylation domain-containing protein [Aliarcobacter butzleri]|uniref:PulJ/GspJ family protein n=1 Tax=Aliarcobacter butzleri TaxID=28197 RepID=UPI0012F84993|nr:prepilin-type N-terminal cleavage/methylation domain-containing protein [Aliarcobacter butzleri]MCG3675306.1 prepilin-type N-terminal cleavage/methylation domain-containing protein [Aliarcobacter butzleri]